MPGLFGAVGASVEAIDVLERSFREIWGAIEVERLPNGAGLGAHAFTGSALFEAPDGTLVARDGDRRAYRAPTAGEISFCGNEARLLPDGSIELRADWSGAFPLYYAADRNGITFSSLLRPLGRALSSSPDPVAISFFIRYAYTCADRSFFTGVRRLLPGQVLRWREGEEERIEEASRAWTAVDRDVSTPQKAAEQALQILSKVLPRSLAEDGDNVLMTSAGWDSRTLLAAATRASRSVRAFSHGDIDSRELRIARDLASAAGVAWRGRSIEPDVWDLDHLHYMFRRCETLVFPHWGWAGRVNEGAACIFSGVFGEVLGGHYGRTQVRRGAGKILELFSGLRKGAGEEEPTDERLMHLESSLTPARVGSLWYLRQGVEEDVDGDYGRRLREDVRRDLERLRDRGVPTASQLLEAFITEHRGAQYITAQALSTRLETDIAVPFGERELLDFASRIPPHVKVHNRVNRALGRLAAPHLLRLPMAATLVPASAPLLLQEASRALRKAYELGRWTAFARSGGRLPRPRLGWVDFEFLRQGTMLREVIGSLQADIWDIAALERRAGAAQSRRHTRSLHPLFDQMGKILTVDRMIG